MSLIIPARGRVYRADIGYGLKPFLVISNNRRNNQLDTCIAVRLTTTRKPEMPSIVRLDTETAFTGSVLCDDLVQLFRDELKNDLGALSRTAMEQVSRALRHALSL